GGAAADGCQREPHPADRRDRHRQGAVRPRGPPGLPAAERALRGHQRGGLPGKPAGERAL
ncbi:Core-binding (CB) domain-containing protein, partial [Dysosmobacter welbionis]